MDRCFSLTRLSAYFTVLLLSLCLAVEAPSAEEAGEAPTMCHLKLDLEVVGVESNPDVSSIREVYWSGLDFLKVIEPPSGSFPGAVMSQTPENTYFYALESKTGMHLSAPTRRAGIAGLLAELEYLSQNLPHDLDSLNNIEGIIQEIKNRYCPVDPLFYHISDDGLNKFTIGNEQLFFDKHKLTKKRSKKIEGQACNVWEVSGDGFEWLYCVGRTSKNPVFIEFKSDSYHFKLHYSIYECDLPLDSTLFELPDDLVLEEISTDDMQQFVDSLKSK